MWLLALLLLQFPDNLIGTQVVVENQVYGRVEDITTTGNVQYLVIGAGEQYTVVPYTLVVPYRGQLVVPSTVASLKRVSWPRNSFNVRHVRAPVIQVFP